ncbi:L30e-like protein [Aulographum hederae CBS 113979]|uniref:H/ACA ribonucleoprotein complex subunit 2 n=1 Tax=Aulographum hederae CBS 113979 TaxID=1176131 RepID=A0A6G1H9Q8_9PEZI|nr:L30e-like protein [Aulographum hederae CBS 113979]
MAKEMKKEKKDKKDKKRSDENGVKKSKKEKRSKSHSESVLDGLENAVEMSGAVIAKEDGDEVNTRTSVVLAPLAALVPFANPLAGEKSTKKALKTVKKANKNKTLRRGVKEVVKAIRKLPPSTNPSDPPAVVILAADISPMDVISHLPVLCEDHNVPYLYVTSRAELGAAGATKRPTSVVMIEKKKPTKKNEKAEDDPEWTETYADIVKVMLKEAESVKL